jgi:hypothetical protein
MTPAFFWGNWRKHENPLSRQSVYRSRNEPRTTQIQANFLSKSHKDCMSQEWNGAAVYCGSNITSHTADSKIHPHSVATLLRNTQQTVKAIHMATMCLSQRSSPWTPAGVFTASMLLSTGSDCYAWWRERSAYGSWIADSYALLNGTLLISTNCA